MEVVVGRSIGESVVRIDCLFRAQEIEADRLDGDVVLGEKQARCPVVIERRRQPFAFVGKRRPVLIRYCIQRVDYEEERFAPKVLMSHEINEWIV